MQQRGQFTFYRSYMEALEDVPEEFRWPAVLSVIEYGLDQKKPQGLESHGRIFFKMAKPTLDAGWRMAEGGKKGQLTRRLRKGSPNEGEKEKEGENENETENEIETETEDESLPGGCAFDEFWNLYPVKIDRDGAKAVFEELARDREKILEGLKLWLDSKQWRDDGGRFIPRPVKWLKEKHYLQCPPQSVPYGATGELGQAELEAIRRMMAD